MILKEVGCITEKLHNLKAISNMLDRVKAAIFERLFIVCFLKHIISKEANCLLLDLCKYLH